ncbi:MAG: hypothetical protein ACTSUE_24735 [Promethearchaeota archaeon]
MNTCILVGAILVAATAVALLASSLALRDACDEHEKASNYVSGYFYIDASSLGTYCLTDTKTDPPHVSTLSPTLSPSSNPTSTPTGSPTAPTAPVTDSPTTSPTAPTPEPPTTSSPTSSPVSPTFGDLGEQGTGKYQWTRDHKDYDTTYILYGVGLALLALNVCGLGMVRVVTGGIGWEGITASGSAAVGTVLGLVNLIWMIPCNNGRLGTDTNEFCYAACEDAIYNPVGDNFQVCLRDENVYVHFRNMTIATLSFASLSFVIVVVQAFTICFSSYSRVKS